MSGERSEALIERRLQVVPRGVGIFAGRTSAASASGARIVDADGRTLIDLAGGIGVMNAGHCDPQVVSAIQTQAAQLLHACIHVATYEPYVALCEKLIELLPHGPRSKAMLVNSGAEAVENAVKIARQATGRAGILCYQGAFHGRTLLALTLTAKSAYKRGCGPFAPEIYRLPFPDRFRNRDLSDAELSARELLRLQESFVRGPIPPEDCAAVIIEPVQGEGGFVPAPSEYLQGLRRLCDAHGILLICDEVQSGFCRTGRWAAYQHAGILPDISTYAKSMGGGLPLGAVVGRAEVMDAAEPGTLGGTYGGNPVACAAALASIAVMQERDLNSRALAIGAAVRARFEALAARCPAVADVRGLGAMMAMELCLDGSPATALAVRTAELCRASGVLLLTAGAFGNIIRVLSPLVIEDADLERALDVIEASLLTAIGP